MSIKKNGNNMRILKRLWEEISYIFINYFVCNIPCWPIRRAIYKMFGMKIGRKSKILMHTKIYAPQKIIIGDRSWINEECYLDGRGGIFIGSDVTIATYAKLITGSHNIDDDEFSYIENFIRIEDNCAIFSDTLILGGTHLKKGVVVSAKSVVRKGIYSSFGIYAGNPAKYIRNRKSSCHYHQKGVILFR